MTTAELKSRLRPETELEARFLDDPQFVEGLRWGVPRYGHPEGSIWRHIIEVNRNVDRLPVTAEQRRKLRIITFVHDTFKCIEDRGDPRDYSKHHSIHARHFLARYVDDELLLNVVELHDEAYYCWRLSHLLGRVSECDRRLERLRDRVGDYWQLYYLFFKCDTATGDKNQAPLRWFERTMDGITVTPFGEAALRR